MAWKIVWLPKGIATYNIVLDYLHKEFTDREIINFSERINQKLEVLEKHPYIGNMVSGRTNTYRTLVHKKITLYYRVRPLKQEIEVMVFWNNLQNPSRLRLR